MRTLHELYLVLWDEIKDKNYIHGLCVEIQYLNNISFEECTILFKHFESQKPNENLHPEFLKCGTWKGGFYWWDDKERFNPINRKAFVKKMIEITK